MTKYEWETALKKNICRLPDDEIKRVMEYYDELFADNIERGKFETAIINEFGNPVDVAEKILSEYDGELKTETEEKKSDSIFEGHADNGSTTAVAQEKAEKSSKNIEIVDEKDNGSKGKVERLFVFVVLNVLTGFTFFILFAVVWIVFVVFVIVGASVAAGGALSAVLSFGVLFNGFFGSGLAQIGLGIACAGIGIMLVVAAVKVAKPMCDLTRKCFDGIMKWLEGKRGA